MKRHAFEAGMLLNANTKRCSSQEYKVEPTKAHVLCEAKIKEDEVINSLHTTRSTDASDASGKNRDTVRQTANTTRKPIEMSKSCCPSAKTFSESLIFRCQANDF